MERRWKRQKRDGESEEREKKRERERERERERLRERLRERERERHCVEHRLLPAMDYQTSSASRLHSSLLQASSVVMLWSVFVWIVPRASQHFCPAQQ